MADRRLLVYGASGHGKVVADAALQAGWELVGFADDDSAKRGSPMVGSAVVAIGFDQVVELCRGKNAHAIVAIGSNPIRKRVFDRLSEAAIPIATILHPRAVVAQTASIGRGTVIFAGVVVNPDSTVGVNVILNTAASVDHDNVIGDHAHLSPGAHLGGTVRVGAGTHIGIGATIRNNIDIGAWSVVGAGAVVVKNLPDRVVAFGNPARVMRENQK